MTSPATPELTVTVSSGDTAHIVGLEGELDITSRQQVQDALDALAKPPLIVALDVTALSFVDSAGLKTVLNEHRRAREEGYEFVVVGAHGAVREVLRLTALDITVPLADDLKAVLGE